MSARTYIGEGDASLHGFEVLLHVQLVDELVSEHDATLCCLVVLVGLTQCSKTQHKTLPMNTNSGLSQEIQYKNTTTLINTDSGLPQCSKTQHKMLPP